MLKKRVAVLGGGITGLSACHYLRKTANTPQAQTIKLSSPSTSRPPSNIGTVMVFEKNPSSTGGWIRTRVEMLPGPRRIVIEGGPRTLHVATARNTLEIINDIGLSDQIITASPKSMSRLVYSGGKIHKLPKTMSPMAAFRSSLLRPNIPHILKDIFYKQPSPQDNESAQVQESDDDESIESFVTRHFGKSVAHELVAPLVTGIYAGNIAKLSVKSCFPRLYALERQYGSIVLGALRSAFKKKPKDKNEDVPAEVKQLSKLIKEKGGVFTFRDGLATLANRLSATHRNCIVMGAPVRKIILKQLYGMPIYDIELEDGRMIKDFTHIISALPAYELAPLVAPYSPEAAQLLNSIEYVDMATVSLTFDDSVNRFIPKDLQGFGYLVPPHENQDILGVVFDSVNFPEQSSTPFETRLTVMMGGDPSAIPDPLSRIHVDALSDNELIERAHKTLSRHLGIEEEPSITHVYRNLRSIPQYHVGHSKKVARVKQLLSEHMPGIVVAGAAFDGVSVNDCITSARKAVEVVRDM